MIDVCCGLSASPALLVPSADPCTCTLVAMLVLVGCLALSFSILVALSGVAVTHIVLRGITITLVARTLKERRGRVAQNNKRRSQSAARRRTEHSIESARERAARNKRKEDDATHTYREFEDTIFDRIYPRPSAWWFVCTLRGVARIDS